MASSSWESRREIVEQIWQAGLNAVGSEQLVSQAVRLTEQTLTIHGQSFLRSELGRIVVVGAGKAGAGMAAGFEAALPEEFLKEKVSGWVNVPADCLRPLQKIHLHPARPAGINEPTTQGVQGTNEILELVSNLAPDDLCVVLISGGGSALLPAPVQGVSLEDKLSITRDLAKAGATIEEMNTVRSALSRIKAGGLLRACQSKNIVTLIISDVVGDPLETIASGPTINTKCNPEQALELLQRYIPSQIPSSIFKHLSLANGVVSGPSDNEPFSSVQNIILGSNARAVAAASSYAKELGYRVIDLGSETTGVAKNVAVQLIETAQQVSRQSISDGCAADEQRPICMICGGETVVPISPDIELGKGGRNQEIALAALMQMAKDDCINICLLAAGTDGEDGPTDAAGAFADNEAIQRARLLDLDLLDYLKRHDSYHFFQATESLLITGPTHTNVMDLCVILVFPEVGC